MPMRLADYGPGWREFSERIRERSRALGIGDQRCECTGECGLGHIVAGCDFRCGEFNGELAKSFRGRVVLTVAHLCMTPKCRAENHVKALCQKCHLAYDRPHRKGRK